MMMTEIMDCDDDGCELAEDEITIEGLRITFLIVGPNGLRWRIISSLDNRAYAAWRLARYYGGAEGAWPEKALEGIRKEPKSIRNFIHDLAKQFAMMFYGNIDRGTVWDIEPML